MNIRFRLLALAVAAAAAFGAAPLQAQTARQGQPRRGDPRRDPQLHRRHRVLGQPGQEGPGEGAPEPEGHRQDRRAARRSRPTSCRTC